MVAQSHFMYLVVLYLGMHAFVKKHEINNIANIS